MKFITTTEQLLKEICTLMDANLSEIKGNCRKRELVKIRQYYCYVGRIYYRFSCNDLGKTIGNRDHSTVIHSKDLVTSLIDIEDPVIINDLEALKSHFELDSLNSFDLEDVIQQLDRLKVEYAKQKKANKKLREENKNLKSKIERLKAKVSIN